MPGRTKYRRIAKTLENLLDARHPNRSSEEKNIAIDGTVRNVDIAGYIGAGKDAVGDSLARLEDDKVIYRNGQVGKIIVIDQSLLKAACYKD